MLPLELEDLFLELGRPLRDLSLGFPLLELFGSLGASGFYIAGLEPAPRVGKDARDGELLAAIVMLAVVDHLTTRRDTKPKRLHFASS